MITPDTLGPMGQGTMFLLETYHTLSLLNQLPFGSRLHCARLQSTGHVSGILAVILIASETKAFFRVIVAAFGSHI